MSPKWMKLLKWCGVAVIALLVIVLAGSTWEYSGKPQFCVTCHSMESVTKSHSNSAHAEVSCTSCHLGVGFAPSMLFKKAKDSSQIVKNLTGTYEKPIRVHNNFPVMESCESCHYTKAFRREMVKVKESFSDDADNSRMTTAMLLKVGDGKDAEGIHWHVENTVKFGKDAEGTIVYLEANKVTGEKATYRLEGAGDPVSYKTMDCVDCHNRVAHRIDTPSSIVDKYFLEGKLDASLPYLKREMVALLSQTKDVEKASWPELFASIVTFYEKEYPEVYTSKQEVISQLPQIGVEMANEIVYPEMLVTWETYENKLGHDGCFKCHNASFKLESAESGNDWPETISNTCMTCHSMPVMVPGGNKTLVIDLQ